MGGLKANGAMACVKTVAVLAVEGGFMCMSVLLAGMSIRERAHLVCGSMSLAGSGFGQRSGRSALGRRGFPQARQEEAGAGVPVGFSYPRIRI